MATTTVAKPAPRWELAAENIAVKIRWFGLLVGYILVNVDAASRIVAGSSAPSSLSGPSTPFSTPPSASAAACSWAGIRFPLA